MWEAREQANLLKPFVAIVSHNADTQPVMFILRPKRNFPTDGCKLLTPGSWLWVGYENPEGRDGDRQAWVSIVTPVGRQDIVVFQEGVHEILTGSHSVQCGHIPSSQFPLVSSY